MLDELQSFKLIVKEGILEAIVNWNNSRAVRNCHLIKFKTPLGETFHIKRDELVSLILIIGSHENQKDLMPMRRQKVYNYHTRLGLKFKASRDYKKGEEIYTECDHMVDIPIGKIMSDYSGNFAKKTNITKSGIITKN